MGPSGAPLTITLTIRAHGPPRRGGAPLEQAYINLILNARDAMDGDGLLRVSLHRRGRSAVAVFADDGPGMDAETRRRATEPFFSRKEKGSGLGLAVVRRILEDPHYRQWQVDHNYRVAQTYYSYRVLRYSLEKLFRNIEHMTM